MIFMEYLIRLDGRIVDLFAAKGMQLGRVPWVLFGKLYLVLRGLGIHWIYALHWNTKQNSFIPLLRKILGKGDTVLDVGANQGYISLLCSWFVGHSGRVYSFEPIPEVAKRIQNLAIAFGRRNLTVENVAVGKEQGEACLFVREPSSHSSLSREFNGTDNIQREVRCRVETLDAFVKKKRIQGIALVKVDVEGAEFEVLKGSGSLCSNGHGPQFVVEIRQSKAREQYFGYSIDDLIHWFQGRGYRCFVMRDHRLIQVHSQKDLMPSDDDMVCAPEGTWFGKP
jgi:FkbM family methyltransferase